MSIDNFERGDYVVAKKFNGEEVIGVYEYPYLDGSHCVKNIKDNHRCCTKKGCIRKATSEEIEEMKIYSPPIEENVIEDDMELVLAAIE